MKIITTSMPYNITALLPCHITISHHRSTESLQPYVTIMQHRHISAFFCHHLASFSTSMTDIIMLIQCYYTTALWHYCIVASQSHYWITKSPHRNVTAMQPHHHTTSCASPHHNIATSVSPLYCPTALLPRNTMASHHQNAAFLPRNGNVKRASSPAIDSPF